MNKQELLRKYLQDQCSHQELQRLYAYLLQDSEEEYKDILYDIWSKLDNSRTIDEETTERIFRKIESDIAEVPDKRELRRYPYLSVAAAVACILVAGALVYSFFFYNPLITAGTAYGKTNVVALPDGSTVYLYGNSTLRYSDDWSSMDHREVWLEGEAFFKVEKKLQDQKKHKKFTVHTSILDVEVLGTRFNVKDRRGKIQVVLNSGQIKLKKLPNDKGEYLMEPGDLVQVGSSRGFKIKKVAKPDLYSLWKRNELYFENQSLSEIARELYDSHGVRLRFENQEIGNRTFTGSTPVDNLQILYTTIQKSFDLEVRQNKNEIIFANKK